MRLLQQALEREVDPYVWEEIEVVMGGEDPAVGGPVRKPAVSRRSGDVCGIFSPFQR